MRIGIIGGTFNPPHIGHIHAAQAARSALELDDILFMPARIPPHKALPEGSPAPEIRLEMTRLAAESAGARVCDMELKREGPSYTADTLSQLKQSQSEDELWLIIGTDMFLTIQNWYQPERIFASARLAVVPRSRGDLVRLAEHKRELEARYDCGVDIIQAQALEISSSQLRQWIAEGIGFQFLPESVREYIYTKCLYGVSEAKKGNDGLGRN